MDLPSRLNLLQSASNALAIPVYVSAEEAAMGQVVFQQFVHEEFEHEGIVEDLLAQEDVQAQGDGIIDENLAAAQEMLLNTRNGQIIQLGEHIRNLANEFSRSPQRQCIRAHADEVDLGAITRDNFWGLMDEVFKRGYSNTKLIALFFFCSDVLIRCARGNLKNIGYCLFKWTLQYIAEKVCQWVHDHGGWEKVVSDAMGNKYVRYAAFGFLVVAISWWTYRIIKK